MVRSVGAVGRLALLGMSLLLVQQALAETSRVVELTEKNFNEHVGQLDNVLVEFYAPWCGHCKRLAPEYEKLALLFRTTKDVVIAKVDCDAEKEVCKRFGVTGFPTIKWFKVQSTTPEDYTQTRSLELLLAYVNSKMGTNIILPAVPSDVVELTLGSFDEVVLDREKHVMVFFYAPWCGHCKSLFPTYERVGQIFKPESDIVIAKVDSTEEHKYLATRFKVTGYPTVWWFPKHNKDGEEYEAGRELGQFVDYVNWKAGTVRAIDGGYTEKAGRNSTFDLLAQQFISDRAERASIVAQAEELAAAAGAGDGSNALHTKCSALYAKVMRSIMDPSKGGDYVEKESARLKRMLAGDLKHAKKEELTLRKNVVAAFLPPPPPVAETQPVANAAASAADGPVAADESAANAAAADEHAAEAAATATS